ncbi:DUF6064 family protein [Mesorhizobium amorphae]|uniref:DUF6064 family protein n=1 Tax=Mesorhizobium amorphae TaxID=71433 RepID=UPI003ECF41FF
MLPFSKEQFLAVFATYNLSIWPAQIVAYVVGLGLVVLLLWPSTRSGRLIAAGLALMWLWTGVAYHGAFFSTINTAAFGFGGLFVTESALLAYFGVVRSDLRFAPPVDALGWLGATFVAYSAILYPLLGMWSGHAYPEMPMFGITPCPVALFSFGMLLLTTSRVSVWLLIVPLVWSLIGGSAAFALSIVQDWFLLFSGIIVVPLILLRDRRGTSHGTV